MLKVMMSLLAFLVSSVGVADDTIDKVIYGVEDRVESNSEEGQSVSEQLRSVGLLIRGDAFTRDGDHVVLRTRRFETYQGYPLCQDESFRGQPVALGGFCSAFLVGPDMIATAGHCVPAGPKYIAFGFDLESGGRIPANNLYRVTSAIANNAEREESADFALYRLDRAVEGRTPFSVDYSAMVEVGDPVHLIGHPSSLPQKLTLNGTVLGRLEGLLMMNLDAYGGNSGSPVVNSETGQVVGIFRGGSPDFTFDRQNRCVRSMRCEQNGPLAEGAAPECLGEVATPASVLGILQLSSVSPFIQ
jgi:hypothetical protein